MYCTKSSDIKLSEEEKMGNTMIKDLTVGNVRKQLLMFALPLLLSNSLQALYNIVDIIVCIWANWIWTAAMCRWTEALTASPILTVVLRKNTRFSGNCFGKGRVR